MNVYELARPFWNFCYINSDVIKPNHIALYFFCIEQCNRLGWKEKFGLPTAVAKEAIGIRSYNTYIATLNDLVEWGFIEMIERSKNQHSANIVALSKFDKALDKALDKAIIAQEVSFIKKQQSTGESTQQSNVQSTGESVSSIDKPVNLKTNIQSTLFSAEEMASFMREHFAKEITARNISRYQMELLNDMITVGGYSKDQLIAAWLNIKRDPWHIGKHFNVVSFSYLNKYETVQKYSGWKEETVKPTKETHANSGDGVDLRAEISKRYGKAGNT